jgi:glucan biosynthesis protein C
MYERETPMQVSGTDGRRPDIDWLRIFATYLLFVFHGAMIFNPAPFFHVRNDQTSMVMLVVAGFISLWHMPLFFLLAGWSAAASLRLRGAAGFLRERTRRLAIPLVIGCVTIGPLIKYFELRSGLDLNHRGLSASAELQEGFAQVIPGGLPVAPPFEEGFLEFLPTFFSGLDRFTWGHLWFVAYLLVFSVLFLPVMLMLVRGARRAGQARHVRGGFALPPRAGCVYLPLVPLVAAQVLLRPYWPGIQNLYDDWANVAYYSTYLFAGLMLARSPALERVLDGERRRALAIASATTVMLLAGVLGVFRSEAVMLAGSAVAGWCFVVAILGYARGAFTRDGPAMHYLRESAFPVYIIHQLSLVLVGYVVVQWSLGIAAKYAIVLVLAVLLTMAFYHFVVRRVPVLRFAYGMRPLPRAARGVGVPSVTGGPVRVGAAGPLVLALGFLLASAQPSCAAAGQDPRGVWWAEGGSARVEILDCGPRLCGRVVWLRSPFGIDGCPLLDVHNPHADLRARPVLGIDILTNLEPEPGRPRRWVGGSIYDPGRGSTYSCTLDVDGDRLELRGYIGLPLIGRTTTWYRVGTEDGRTCRR